MLQGMRTPVLWRVVPWLFSSVILIQLVGLFPLVQTYRRSLYEYRTDNVRVRVESALAARRFLLQDSLDSLSGELAKDVTGLAVYAPDGSPLAHFGRALDTPPNRGQSPEFRKLDARTLRLEWPLSIDGKNYYAAAAVDISAQSREVDRFLTRAALLAIPGAIVATSACGAILLFVIILPLRRLRDELLGRVEVDGRLSSTGHEDGYDELAQVRTLMRRLDEARTVAREAERVAEVANQAKDEFLANMSHELRSPLASVVSYADVLLETSSASDLQLRKDLTKIRGAARHVADLVGEILTFSKLEAGRTQLELASVDIRTTIDETLAMIDEPLRRNDNQLIVDVAPELDTMHSDALKVRQILLNILGNAAKFTSRGQITLRAHAESGQVVFSVSDTGIGMTTEQMAKVFEPFVQADGSTTRLFGGTGLGLTIAERLCTALGGRIEVESALGRGSTFTVRLPARAPSERARSPDTGP
jgi:signal transduction histidine kinase